ncbi:MAG: ABC transporter substrate-binding protein, partial [Bryobacteraceae bacterium]
LLLAGCARTSNETVRVITYPILDAFPFYLAQELGHFRDEDVAVATEELTAGPKIMESLVAGSADVSTDGLLMAILMAAQGRPLKAFFNTHEAALALLVAAPAKADRIRRIADLKGATIGVASFGGLHHRMLAYYLQRSGLSLSEVQLAATGVAASSVAAIQHGKVDAAMIAGSNLALLKTRAPGLRILLDARSREQSKALFGVEAFPAGGGLLATAQWISGNPGKARALARAMRRTLRWIGEHSAEEVIERIPTRLRSEDRTLDLEHLRLAIGLLSKDGRFPPGGPEAVQRVVAASLETAKSIDLGSTWTNEFLEAE